MPDTSNDAKKASLRHDVITGTVGAVVATAISAVAAFMIGFPVMEARYNGQLAQLKTAVDENSTALRRLEDSLRSDVKEMKSVHSNLNASVSGIQGELKVIGGAKGLSDMRSDLDKHAEGIRNAIARASFGGGGAGWDPNNPEIQKLLIARDQTLPDLQSRLEKQEALLASAIQKISELRAVPSDSGKTGTDVGSDKGKPVIPPPPPSITSQTKVGLTLEVVRTFRTTDAIVFELRATSTERTSVLFMQQAYINNTYDYSWATVDNEAPVKVTFAAAVATSSLSRQQQWTRVMNPGVPWTFYAFAVGKSQAAESCRELQIMTEIEGKGIMPFVLTSFPLTK